MQTLVQITDDALRVLKHVLVYYASEHGIEDTIAIACECDPGAASLYIHIAWGEDDIFDDPMSWTRSYIEQSCPPYQEPRWFAEFDEMNRAYFESTDDESMYSQSEGYLERILDGVSQALVNMRTELTRLGYPVGIKLAVLTEDDDTAMTRFARVEKLESRPGQS